MTSRTEESGGGGVGAATVWSTEELTRRVPSGAEGVGGDADAYVANPEREKALAGVADKLEGPMKLEFGEVRSAVAV